MTISVCDDALFERAEELGPVDILTERHCETLNKPQQLRCKSMSINLWHIEWVLRTRTVDAAQCHPLHQRASAIIQREPNWGNSTGVIAPGPIGT